MNRLICCLRADGYALTRRRFIWLLPLCFAALIVMDSADFVRLKSRDFPCFYKFRKVFFGCISIYR